MAAGTAIGAAASNANASNAYQSGYAAGTAQGYSTGSAQGYAAGSQQGYAPGSGNAQLAMGAIYATLPASCSTPQTVNDATFYLCGPNGNSWVQPAYGANGVYHRVVPSPY